MAERPDIMHDMATPMVELKPYPQMRLHRAIAVMTVVLSTTSCYKFTNQGAARVKELESGEVLHSARIYSRNAARVVLSDAVVRPDSVFGFRDGSRVAFPRADVTRIEERHFSPARTVLGVAVGAGGAMVAWTLFLVLSGSLGDN
jgi:hypothetical protein